MLLSYFEKIMEAVNFPCVFICTMFILFLQGSHPQKSYLDNLQISRLCIMALCPGEGNLSLLMSKDSRKKTKLSTDS